MNKKIITAILSVMMFCSCTNDPQEQQTTNLSETEETTLTTTSEVITAVISEDLKEVSETAVSEDDESETDDFFDDDVIFEDVLLRTKLERYANDPLTLYDIYDEAGNLSVAVQELENKSQFYFFEYDYNPDGTYNSKFMYRDGVLLSEEYYDENGCCIREVGTALQSDKKFEYEYDQVGRLIRKAREGQTGYEYTYDESGRICEERYDNRIYRHEYTDSIENVYITRNDENGEQLYKVIEFNENGDIKKETVYRSAMASYYIDEMRFVDYEYDDKGWLIRKIFSSSGDYENDNEGLFFEYIYEYDGDDLKKETFLFHGYMEITEYFYDELGRTVKEISNRDSSNYDGTYMDLPPKSFGTMEYIYNDDGTMTSYQYSEDNVLLEKTEYEFIKKIKTDIVYRDYEEVEP